MWGGRGGEQDIDNLLGSFCFESVDLTKCLITESFKTGSVDDGLFFIRARS